MKRSCYFRAFFEETKNGEKNNYLIEYYKNASLPVMKHFVVVAVGFDNFKIVDNYC
jgi:uncharacterized alpha/beta hydrolase family protein